MSLRLATRWSRVETDPIQDGQCRAGCRHWLRRDRCRLRIDPDLAGRRGAHQRDRLDLHPLRRVHSDYRHLLLVEGAKQRPVSVIGSNQHCSANNYLGMMSIVRRGQVSNLPYFAGNRNERRTVERDINSYDAMLAKT